MTITPDNYLDLRNLLINELFGSPSLAMIVLSILLWYGVVKWHLPFEVGIGFQFLLIALIMLAEINFLIWAIVAVVFGVLIYTALPKIIKR